RSNPDKDLLPDDFDPALRDGDRLCRPGHRELAGSVKGIGYILELRANDSHARSVPDDSIARRAGGSADACGGRRVGSTQRCRTTGQGCRAGGDAVGAAESDLSSGACATESSPPNRTVSTSELSFSDITSARNPIRVH